MIFLAFFDFQGRLRQAHTRFLWRLSDLFHWSLFASKTLGEPLKASYDQDAQPIAASTEKVPSAAERVRSTREACYFANGEARVLDAFNPSIGSTKPEVRKMALPASANAGITRKLIHRSVTASRFLQLTRYSALAGVFSLTVTIAALAATHAVVEKSYPRTFWLERLEWIVRPAVYDDKGMLVGFVPPKNFVDLESTHAAEPDQITDACINLVLLREDAHRDEHWRTLFGVDLGGVVRSALTLRGGASNLNMQVARQLAGWHKFGTLGRKIREFGAAQTISDLVKNDSQQLARIYLSIAPFAAKTYGDIRGITAIADAMWGVKPSQLTTPQCAVLVSMLAQRPSLIATNDHAKEVWRKRKTQALFLLTKQSGGITREQAAEIESMGELPPTREQILGIPEAATLNLGARTRALVLPNLRRIVEDQGGASNDL